MKKLLALAGCLAFGMACGGKTAGDGTSGAAGSMVGQPSSPPPTCTVICNRLVALCSGSPNASCQSDCDATKAKFAACPRELDRFLQCMGTTNVQCTPGEVVVIDCSDERVDLERCGQ